MNRKYKTYKKRYHKGGEDVHGKNTPSPYRKHLAHSRVLDADSSIYVPYEEKKYTEEYDENKSVMLGDYDDGSPTFIPPTSIPMVGDNTLIAPHHTQIPIGTGVNNKDAGWSFSDIGHLVLDGVGVIPGIGEVADGVNALWYAAEGDKTNAALSTAAMIPFFGWGATAAKTGNKINKAVKATDATIDVVKAADVPQAWAKGVTNYGKVDYSVTQDVLKNMKAQGKHLDDIGYDVSKHLNSKNIKFHGTQNGRTIVEVALPDGKTQLFYKSTDLSGKGVEGVWQPFGGHASTVLPGHGKVDNWFIKDAGYKDFYGSKSYRDIADNLDLIAETEGWDMSKQVLKSQMKQKGGFTKQKGGTKISLTKQGFEPMNEYFLTNDCKDYKCSQTDSAVTLRPTAEFGYNTGDKSAFASFNPEIEIPIAGDRLRGVGGSVLGLGVKSEGKLKYDINDPNAELDLSGSIMGTGRIGWNRYEYTGRAGGSKTRQQAEAGVYGNYDILNKNMSDIGLYGRYGPIKGNLGYDLKDKQVKAGIGLTFQDGGYLKKEEIPTDQVMAKYGGVRGKLNFKIKPQKRMPKAAMNNFVASYTKTLKRFN